MKPILYKTNDGKYIRLDFIGYIFNVEIYLEKYCFIINSKYDDDVYFRLFFETKEEAEKERAFLLSLFDVRSSYANFKTDSTEEKIIKLADDLRMQQESSSLPVTITIKDKGIKVTIEYI